MNLIFTCARIKVLTAILVIASFIFLSLAVKTQAQPKMHEIENYYVTYEFSGNSTGTKQHASRDFGRKQCWIEKSEMNVEGNSIKKNEKVITMLQDGDQWIITINLDNNTGTRMKNPMYGELAESMKGNNPKEFSEQFMQQMGGEIVGDKTVNGEKCTEWTLMGGARTCVTKDLITVESGADMAGISITETATEVKRNDPGPEGICDIGDAKIQEVDLGKMIKHK